MSYAPAHSAHAEEFDAHGHKDHGHVIVSIWTLRAVLLALLFFTLLTSGAAVIEQWISSTFNVVIPQWLNVFVALSIAVVKTALVVMFFMQLKYDNPLNTMVFIFTLITVAFFLGFTALDVGKRQTVDRFKGVYINDGGNLNMGGLAPSLKPRIDALNKRIAELKAPAAPANLSLAELSRLEQRYGLRPHGHGHGHAHGHGHGDLEIITNAGYKRPVPDRGSSEQFSRPIRGLTLPEFAPAQHDDHHHDVHDPSAAGDHAAPKPAETPAKH
ncbi:MAG: cytochrome C oxidase subunit IV family protein [Phycisphaerales bacterium]